MSVDWVRLRPPSGIGKAAGPSSGHAFVKTLVFDGAEAAALPRDSDPRRHCLKTHL
jgi:hypothetical protein